MPFIAVLTIALRLAKAYEPKEGVLENAEKPDCIKKKTFGIRLKRKW